MPATLASFPVTIRAVGEIRTNERAIEMVQNRVNGFIEKLLVRAEGDPVKQGQKLAEVYAPELLAAQEELLALNKLNELQGVEQLRKAARARLRYYLITHGNDRIGFGTSTTHRTGHRDVRRSGRRWEPAGRIRRNDG